MLELYLEHYVKERGENLKKKSHTHKINRKVGGGEGAVREVINKKKKPLKSKDIFVTFKD